MTREEIIKKGLEIYTKDAVKINREDRKNLFCCMIEYLRANNYSEEVFHAVNRFEDYLFVEEALAEKE